MVPSLSLLSCELSVSARENPDRQKKEQKQNKKKTTKKTHGDNFKYLIQMLIIQYLVLIKLISCRFL